MTATIQKQNFGDVDSMNVELYTLTNESGAQIKVSTYGGILSSLKVPDKDGKLGDVVLGFNNLDGYLNDAYMASKPYFGSTVGRYSDRIAGGKFTLDGKEYNLSQNNDENTLHGGAKGFNEAVWSAKTLGSDEGPAVELSHTSPDGDQGFPGNLTITVRYTLTNENAVKIEYLGTTDAPTVINMTNHSYFNLAGEGSGEILDHKLMINADRYVVNIPDSGLIPTGEFESLAGTPLDFRVATAVGARIHEESDLLPWGGYANNYVLNKEALGSLSLAATAYEPTTGRLMQIYTTEPAMLFYSGHGLDGTLIGKSGKAYAARAGMCLETQHFANSPNIPEFPSVVLRPGEEFTSTTIYKFSIF